MKVNSDHKAIAERLGEGVFFHTQRNQFLLLEQRASSWELVLLDTGWEKTTQYNLLALDEKYLVKLPPDSRDIESMLELWQAKQEGQSKLGRCTPHSCCPSHATQQLADELASLEAESCDCDSNPVMQLFGSLLAAREVADEEMVTGFISDSVTNDMFKVTIQYIGNRAADEDDE